MEATSLTYRLTSVFSTLSIVLADSALRPYLLELPPCSYISTRTGKLSSDINFEYSFPVWNTSLVNNLQYQTDAILPKFTWIRNKTEPVEYCGVIPPNVNAASGHWEQLADYNIVWEPEGCVLRRLTANAARRCLAGKFIAFIGDSVTRYQYLTFAHFLSKGRWPARYHQNGKSLAKETDWNDWAIFFEESSALISETLEADGAEVCDCYRTNNMTMTTFHLIRESRLLCINPKAAPGTCKKDPYGPGDPKDSNIRVAFAPASAFPHWVNHTLNATEHLMSLASPPNLVIVNADTGAPSTHDHLTGEICWDYLRDDGLWVPMNSLSEEEARADFDRLFKGLLDLRARHHNQTQLLWKSTTAARIPDTQSEQDKAWWHQDHLDAINAATELGVQKAVQWGVPVYHAGGPGQDAVQQGMQRLLHWDHRVHFWAYMYQEMSDLLLNMLCSERCEYQGDSLWDSIQRQRPQQHPPARSRQTVTDL